MGSEAYKEPIIYQHSALCMKVWRFVDSGIHPIQEHPWHYHKEIEFIYVEAGRHVIETTSCVYTLEAGDVVLLGSSQLHRVRESGALKVQYIVLHLDLEPYFDHATQMYMGHYAEVQEPLDRLNYIFEQHDARLAVGKIISSIHQEVMAKAKGYELAVSMHVKHLMLCLLRFDNHNKLQSHTQLDTAFIRPITDYVDKHLSERIDMQEVCRLAGMSYTYFSKYFKRKIGLSFTDYVNRKRIERIKRLLVTERSSIQEIAESVGIHNMAHFYELFKRYNDCTPRQYLMKMLGEDAQR